MHRLLLFFFLVLGVGTAFGQQAETPKKYLVYLTDKTGTPYTTENPEQFLSAKAIARRQRQQIPVTSRDLPVNPAYVQRIKETGAEVWYTSRWFNAVVIRATQTQLTQVNSLDIVRQAQALNRVAAPAAELSLKTAYTTTIANAAAASPEATDYGRAFHQAEMLGATELHAAGFRGEDMTIAVLDAGFPNVNTISAFTHLFQNNQISGTFDFVTRSKNAYVSSSHGTAVLSTMAAYEPGKMIGTAYKANYLLLRTEDAASEHNIEEVNWLIAAEYADSAGADVLNSSLGYYAFDAPSVSYSYQQMDGNTTIVTKAADFAAATGMLIVTSAGNEGNKAWRYITAPADGDSVLAVGAVDSLTTIASFSSRGPAADGRVKPDVVALGLNAYVLNTAGNVVKNNGTSFSGPIMAGFAAVLWQAHNSKTNYEIIQLIRQLGNQAANPDNNYGYGVPNYSRIVTGLPMPAGEEGALVVNPVAGNDLVLLLDESWQGQRLEVQLLNATGKIVHTYSLPAAQERQTINLQPLALQQGVYLCRVRSGRQVATIRFVKL
ncbi:S8 family serine peptidase [Pontibacter sp. Tf4]|uniref:S8 family serine peptidase n=1 Tax=Pontibacter sp. Tf4 TaxID=2761620 RepID=UPI001623DA56|nr:S8 family serine peptidase [Pontibacter sp. Tf4]MBB6610163.1 S8 family serine peptidase [Pontibacter sp. Tf4]